MISPRSVSSSVLLVIVLLILGPHSVAVRGPGQLQSHTVEIQIPDDGDVDPSDLEWAAPVGVSYDDRPKEVIVYSREGQTIRYGVKATSLEDGDVGLAISSNASYRVPGDVELLLPTMFRGTELLVFANTTLHVLADDMTTMQEVPLGFRPTHFSNLWNRGSVMNSLGNMYVAMVNGTTIGLYAKVPPNTVLGELRPKTFFDRVSLRDIEVARSDEVIGEPIVLDVFDPHRNQNGSAVVVPTDKGVLALALDIEIADSQVKNVSLGDPGWYITYEAISERAGRPVQPVRGRPISIVDEDPTEYSGKDRIILVGTDGCLCSILRRNGSLEWISSLEVRTLIEPRPRGAWPTDVGALVVAGADGAQGFVAMVDPTSGCILADGTQVANLDAPAVGRPRIIPDTGCCILSTESGRFYILGKGMGLLAEFAIQGGTVTPVNHVGCLISGTNTLFGHYLAVVTANATLHIQSLTGTYFPGPEVPYEPEEEESESPGFGVLGALIAAVAVVYFSKTSRARDFSRR